MNTEQQAFLLRVKANLHHCKWFIEQYFGADRYRKILALLDEGKALELYNDLNDIWFRLPDNRFNIMVMPQGWRQFLYMIEI